MWSGVSWRCPSRADANFGSDLSNSRALEMSRVLPGPSSSWISSAVAGTVSATAASRLARITFDTIMVTSHGSRIRQHSATAKGVFASTMPSRLRRQLFSVRDMFKPPSTNKARPGVDQAGTCSDQSTRISQLARQPAIVKRPRSQ
jgi:hypothetical protein